MLEQGASDLHLTAGAKSTMRVNGRLGQLEDYPVLQPAQTSLRNALVAAKSIYTDKQDYGQAIKTASTGPGVVSATFGAKW